MWHDVPEPASQFVEKRLQIAVCDDRFRHGQQSPVWIVSERCLRVRISVGHRPPSAAINASLATHAVRILTASRTAHGSRKNSFLQARYV